jgi:hypothetical protein
MTEDAVIISRPKRSTVCELFSITESVQLDEIARRELRTVMEFWSLCKPVVGQVLDIHQPSKNEFHQNTVIVDFLAKNPEGKPILEDAASLTDLIIDKGAQANHEQFLYFTRSSYFMSILRTIALVDANGNYMINPCLSAAKSIIVYMGELAIVGHYLRKYPFIRFDIYHFVQFVIHYEGEVDKHGCPRVSIDGYRNV